jgi:predicted nucleic acid-binding Zn ribbon protein
MSKEFSSVNEQLKRLLKNYRLEQQYAEYEIKENWEKLLNKQLAGVTIPQSLENKVLTISVTNELWKKEIFARKKELLEMLNSSLESIKLENIKIV